MFIIGYVGHQLTAFTFYLVFLVHFVGGTISFIPVIISLISAILPDIDEPQSYIGRRLRLISNIFKALFGHRGFTHSILSMLIFGFIFYLSFVNTGIFPFYYIWYFVIGYSSHLLGDLVTKSGIPLFSPFSSKKIALKFFATGSSGEKFVILGLLSVTIYFFIQIYPSSFYYIHSFF